VLNKIRRFFVSLSSKRTKPQTYTPPDARTEAYFDHERITLPPPERINNVQN
jgi:hypothetical protein